MMNRSRLLCTIVLAGAACARPATVASPASGTATPAPVAANAGGAEATATLIDVVSTTIGSVTLTDTPAGLLITGYVTGLGIGSHGAHLHAVGLCQTPTFASAGPHFNPSGRQHGFRNPRGHHDGDLPNLISPPAGRHSFQMLARGVRLTGRDGLLDDDGASIIIHSAADDHASDPAGDSGSRYACGVIRLK